ncbi:MAG: DUF4918 family protein [Planctomycetes bacterium]|nr:DUF4918 family protein [Planctomycetota bacterium]
MRQTGKGQRSGRNRGAGTFAERVIAFNQSLSLDATLPDGIRVMNPFREDDFALTASSEFYRKYYNDNNPRHFILGINPGRFGGGLTGVPFTDPKRLRDRCGIDAYHGPDAHEPSSVFVYEVIRRYGGEEAFYRDFYINSISPLGFTAPGKRGGEVNCNYYDRRDLADAVTPFMVDSLRRQIDFGIDTRTGICLGLGKNARFIEKLNATHQFFGAIFPLKHPRYIIQYKSKSLDAYADKYVATLRSVAAAG